MILSPCEFFNGIARMTSKLNRQLFFWEGYQLRMRDSTIKAKSIDMIAFAERIY